MAARKLSYRLFSLRYPKNANEDVLTLYKESNTSTMPGVFFPRQKRTPRWLKILIVIVLFIVAIVFIVPPSSWLIPNEPIFPGSPGAIFSPIPDYDPRWRWLEMRGWIAVPALKDALKNGTSYAKGNSAEMLGNRHDIELIPELERLLSLDSDKRVRYSAAAAIAEVGGSEASKSLCRVAARDSHESEQAIYGLGILKDLKTADFLFALMEKDTTDLPAVRALKEMYGAGFSQEVITRFRKGSLTIDRLAYILITEEHAALADYKVLIPELNAKGKASKKAVEIDSIEQILNRIHSN